MASIAVFIATLAAAHYVLGLTEHESVGNTLGSQIAVPMTEHHPWWTKPLAVLIVCCGVGVGLVILASRRYFGKPS